MTWAHNMLTGQADRTATDDLHTSEPRSIGSLVQNGFGNRSGRQERVLVREVVAHWSENWCGVRRGHCSDRRRMLIFLSSNEQSRVCMYIYLTTIYNQQIDSICSSESMRKLSQVEGRWRWRKLSKDSLCQQWQVLVARWLGSSRQLVEAVYLFTARPPQWRSNGQRSISQFKTEGRRSYYQ